VAKFKRQRHETVLLAIVIVIGVLALMEMGSATINLLGNPVVLFTAVLIAIGVVLATSRAERPAKRERPSN
jgi:hypothetical protein